MNPHTSIKLWLLAAGQQFGINEAYYHVAPDPSSRPVGPYCVYRLPSTVSIEKGIEYIKAKDGTTVSIRTRKRHLTTVEVDLYRREGGLLDLAAIAIAAEAEGAIFRLLKSEGVAFEELLGVEELTPREIQGDLIEHYHQRMTCTFNETIGHNMTEANGVVNTIILHIQEGMGTFEIDADGVRETTI